MNYGRRQDFQQLQAAGINVTGKIVIARYAKNFRGNKVNGVLLLSFVFVVVVVVVVVVFFSSSSSSSSSIPSFSFSSFSYASFF